MNWRIAMTKIIITLGIILLLVSCVHTAKLETGKPIEETQIEHIKKGLTTSAEIISLFGAPSLTSTVGEEELFIYKFCITDYRVTQLSTSSKENCNELTLTFDKITGKVKDYNYRKRIRD
jgi:outer membrane protein assembly factor BamE (lipoprotein component of BamABCDE complex)